MAAGLTGSLPFDVRAFDLLPLPRLCMLGERETALDALVKTGHGERFSAANRASDPESLRRELGTIGQFFLWDVDRVWLTDQLITMLNAGFAPNDAFGVIDNLAKLLPERIDKVVEATNLLVRQPNVQAWIFASQDQSSRTILAEGKKSLAPGTAATVKEIVSYLASRGNPSFLDLDDD